MNTDPELALQKLVAALEFHLDACRQKRSGVDENLERAYEMVEDAFLSYEEALASAHDEYLPIALAEDE
ncbi:hypothetical protein [Aquiluna sp. KACHI24]|uniref:hypothetical protein n=1 Tax=Aquiluna sp. KACHI24 TaxID=2968831 RepID=UPI002204F116|nr:hypothetical protein [Aquiluna sp. KACHI24]BDQ00228.1 hypothetical protein AKACHI_05640 [Aquiluna sp. KACHI24]